MQRCSSSNIRFWLLVFVLVSCSTSSAGLVCDQTAADAFAAQARGAEARRQMQAAVQNFERARDACPNSRGILLELANALLMLGRIDDAQTQADGILRLQPGEPNALKIKANAEYLRKRFAEAENTLIGVLERYPKDEEAAYMLGRMYYEQGRIDHAIGQFLRVLRINPAAYKAYDNLGLCYQARKESETAIRYFLTAIKLVEKDHPEYDWPYANLASLLIDEGDPAKGFAAASKAADRNPYSARNFYLGAKALWKLEKTELAINWLERSISLDPSYAEPLYLLGRIYGKLGQAEKSKAMFDRFSAAKAKNLPPPK